MLAPNRRGAAKPTGHLRSVGSHRLGARQVVSAPLSLVLPRVPGAHPAPSRLARLHELEERHRRHCAARGRQFRSLRSYVVGDDPRDIDASRRRRNDGAPVQARYTTS